MYNKYIKIDLDIMHKYVSLYIRFKKCFHFIDRKIVARITTNTFGEKHDKDQGKIFIEFL